MNKNYIPINRYCNAAKDTVVAPFDTARIIQEAREMRALELRRMQGVMAERATVYLGLLAGSALALAEVVRRIFSWNPQDPATRRRGPSLMARANHMLRACFSWNPQARRF